MKKFNCMVEFAKLLLAIMLLAGCASTTKDNRVIMAQHDEPDDFTHKTERLLHISSRFKKRTYAMNPMDERLAAIREYEGSLRPYLTESFDKIFRNYVESMMEAFKTQGPSSRYDTAQDDPILQRRWEPDVVLLSRVGGETPDEEIVVINEILLDGKIYTGYQGETRLIFKRAGNSWLLDDVKTRRRYTYDNSIWEPVESTRHNLQSAIKVYSKDIKSKGQQAAPSNR